MVEALRHKAVCASLAATLVLSIPELSVLDSSAQTDNEPPTIINHSPHRDASGLADVIVTATFSETVQASSISLVLRSSTNAGVPTSTMYDASRRTAILNPLEPLAGGTYTVTVAGAMDSAGNVQVSPVVWSFTVSNPGFQGPVFRSGLAKAPVHVATWAPALAFLSSTHVTGVEPAAVTASDSNSDGHPDITTRNTVAPSVSVPMVDAGGTSKVNAGAARVASSNAVHVADFNHDGRYDLATANTSVNTVSVLLGDGNGTFEAASDIGARSGPSGLATGDLSVDGSLDLAPSTGSPQTIASADVSELDVTAVTLGSGAVSTPEILSDGVTTADLQPISNAPGSPHEVVQSGEALAIQTATNSAESLSPGLALPIISDPMPTTVPTFSWSAVPEVSYYALSIADADVASPVLVWFTPVEAGCATGLGTCTVAAPRALAPGLVSWNVLTWNSYGYGPWSTTATLVISVPDPATPTPKPVAPSGAIATRTPTYVWQAASGATNWYQLSVTDVLDIVHDFWYTPTAACNTTLCSQSPNILLPIGPARWRVRAFSGLGAGAWSPDTSFEVADTAPGKATLVAPVSSALTSTPVFTWNAVLGTSYYLLRLVDRDNVTVDRWYRPADAGCPLGTGICSASPGALKPGPANWQVLTWNGSGYGPWSDRQDFVVEVTDPLAPTLTAMSPSGVITTTNPTYTWTAATGVTAYRLSIRNSGGQPVYSWYTPAAAGCTAAPTCSATPQGGLQNGTTDEWQVQAWTTVGSGPWTAPVVFTVSIAVPRPIPSADQQVSAVRLVEYGWDSPRPEFVRAHITDMERRPFNGVVMRLPDGGGDVFRPEAWDAYKLALQLPILRDIRWQSFDSNFLAMYAASSMDWYDDADWSVVLEHAAFMARAAREGHCKGLMFDPEPYGPSPWTYSEQPHASAHTFSEYEAVVRERGRAFMRALEQEYPELDLLTFYGYSYFLRASAAPDVHTRETLLKDQAWGLLPAFLDGMLEEADSDTQIIDGHEQSYYSERPEDFAEAAWEVREGAFPWVSSELWDSYTRHVQGAQPLYLDWIFGYFKTSASSLGNGLSDEQRARLAEHHAYYAMKNVDRYVWLYSEKMNWWTGEHLPPGAEDALWSAQRKFRAGENLGFDLASIAERTP